MVLMLLVLLLPHRFSQSSLLIANLLTFFTCLFAGWQIIDTRYCLKHLYPKNPQLLEAVSTCLALNKQEPPSQEAAYFRDKHLEDSYQLVQRHRHSFHVNWFRVLMGAGFFEALMLFTIGGTLMLPDSLLPKDSLSKQVTGNTYRILYPAYISRPPTIYNLLPEFLSMPQGSRLEIYYAGQKVPTGPNVYKTLTGEYPLTWFSKEEHWLSIVTPQESGELSLSWNSQKHPIEMIQDLPPSLEVQWPNEPHFFANSKLTITLSAEDDYGLQQIHLYYQSKASAEKGQEIIQAFEGEFKTYQESYPWELSTTPLRGGDQVIAWIEVSDIDSLNGPHLTTSKQFEFTVENSQEYHEKIIKRFRQIAQDLSDLLSWLDRKLSNPTTRQEKLMTEKLDLLDQDAKYDQLLSEELKMYLMELKQSLQYYQSRRQQVQQPAL
ncbi:DUF4175 family protein [Deltaproteobacteria bacterium TL4]